MLIFELIIFTPQYNTLPVMNIFYFIYLKTNKGVLSHHVNLHPFYGMGINVLAVIHVLNGYHIGSAVVCAANPPYKGKLQQCLAIVF